MSLDDRYNKAFTIMIDGNKVSGETLLSAEEENWIMGRTIQQLFPGAW